MTHGARLARLSGLYGIIDDGPGFSLPAVSWAMALADGGASVVQLRFKHTAPREALALARAVRAVLPRQLLIVNDRPDLAVLADADGVHVGDEDLLPDDARRVVGPERLVGATVRTIGGAQTALASGADHLGVGPVFESTTKGIAVTPLGPEGLRAICRAVAPTPVVAIAGIDGTNLGSVIDAGATAVAVVSAIGRAQNATLATRELAEMFRGN